MKVTVCEIIANPATLEAQWQALSTHVQDHHSEFLLLPEMPFSPWLCASEQVTDDAWQQAIDSHEKWLTKVKQLPCHTILTLPVLENGKRLHRTVAIENGQMSALHDKFYLPNEEYFWESNCYERGDGQFKAALIGEAKVGMQMCTEIWYQEHSRHYGQQGTHLLANPRANYPEDQGIWKNATVTAAYCSGNYVLTSNLLPEDLGAGVGAGAWVVNPAGETIAQTGPGEYMVTVNIDLHTAQQAKQTYPCYIK